MSDSKLDKNWNLIKSPADGDCFYHSVVNGIKLLDSNSNISIKELKVKVSEYIKKDYQNKKDKTNTLYNDILIEWRDFGVIKKDQDVTLDKMVYILTNTNEWAVSTIIHIVSLILQIQIIVHEKINSKVYSESFPSFYKEDSKDAIKLYTLHVLKRGNHYDLLYLKEKCDTKTSVNANLISLSFVSSILFVYFIL